MENKLTNDFEKLYGNLYDAMVAENKKILRIYLLVKLKKMVYQVSQQ